MYSNKFQIFAAKSDLNVVLCPLPYHYDMYVGCLFIDGLPRLPCFMCSSKSYLPHLDRAAIYIFFIPFQCNFLYTVFMPQNPHFPFVSSSWVKHGALFCSPL